MLISLKFKEIEERKIFKKLYEKLHITAQHSLLNQLSSSTHECPHQQINPIQRINITAQNLKKAQTKKALHISYISSCKKNIHQPMAPASTLLLHALDPYLLFLAEPIGSCCNFTIQLLQFLLLPLQSNLQLEMLILLVLQHQLRPYLYTLLLYYAALEVLDRWAKARDIPETRAQKRDVCRVGISLLQLGVEVGSGGVGFRGVKDAAKLGEDAFEELGLYLWREVGVGDRIERLSQISQLLHFHGKHYKIIRQKLLRSSIFTPSKHLKNNKTSPSIHIQSNCVIFILFVCPKQPQRQQQSLLNQINS